MWDNLIIGDSMNYGGKPVLASPWTRVFHSYAPVVAGVLDSAALSADFAAATDNSLFFADWEGDGVAPIQSDAFFNLGRQISALLESLRVPTKRVFTSWYEPVSFGEQQIWDLAISAPAAITAARSDKSLKGVGLFDALSFGAYFDSTYTDDKWARLFASRIGLYRMSYPGALIIPFLANEYQDNPAVPITAAQALLCVSMCLFLADGFVVWSEQPGIAWAVAQTYPLYTTINSVLGDYGRTIFNCVDPIWAPSKRWITPPYASAQKQLLLRNAPNFQF
jgi:hypothetical protein